MVTDQNKVVDDYNEKDLKEVPQAHRRGMKFYPVKHFDEVLQVALRKN